MYLYELRLYFAQFLFQFFVKIAKMAYRYRSYPINEGELRDIELVVTCIKRIQKI